MKTPSVKLSGILFLLYVPLAILERNGKRDIMRFEADTEEEAIKRGKTEMAHLREDCDRWAFAWEGLLSEKGNKIDANREIAIDGIGGPLRDGWRQR